jgi:ElaB/YqjD/DUF883 family membrane-anchored ribosome-binding protein
MRKTQNDIKTLSEAIHHLEKSGQHKTKDLQEAFGKEFSEIKEAFENLKPQLEKMKEAAAEEAHQVKKDVEKNVKEHPWISLGIASLVGIFIGWLFGRGSK